MNTIETSISQDIPLSAVQFAPIFAKAWYVVIDGDLYEKVDDYEKENGELCTVFSGVDNGVVYEIDYKYEKISDVLYNTQTGEYNFLSQDLQEIPAFKILGLINISMKTYTVLVNDIKWSRPQGVDLPGNGVFEIKSCTNPQEKLFRDEVVNGLMKEYGYPVVSIGDIKELNEATGLGKQI